LERRQHTCIKDLVGDLLVPRSRFLYPCLEINLIEKK